MKNCNSLPGIISISCLPCKLVQRNSDLKYLSGMPVQVFTTPIPIDFKGMPTCETISQYDNNGRNESTTLKFMALSPVPLREHLAFIVTDANRRSYLLGLHEAPYPIIKISHSTGTPDGDPAVYAHEITFKALKSLIPLG